MNTCVKVTNLWKIFTEDQTGIDVTDKDQLRSITDSDDCVVAVCNVSFTIEKGIIFVIMGLSGSGKSTLIRCLIRLVPPTEGTVTINDYEVTSLNKKDLVEFRRNQTAMVFQHYGLFPHRTVLENAAFGLKVRGVLKKDRYEKARAILKLVGLKGWENYYPAGLSGGMRQRVGLARALVMDAPVLLMDEPFSGLDPLIRREMQSELLRIQEEMQKTILFVTHSLDEALNLGERLAIMNEGEFVQSGKPKEILANPADDYVRRFVMDKRKQLEAADTART